MIDDDDQPNRHLIESTLWKEDVYESDHRSVWGSWYDPKEQRWGYACCRGVQKGQPCTAASAAEGQVTSNLTPNSSSCEDDYSTDSEEAAASEQALDWSDPPTELLSREKVGSAADFIDHFVRYIIGAWRNEEAAGFKGFKDMERRAFQDALSHTEQAVTPLLRRLKKGEKLERGETRESMLGTACCRETRTSMEGKFLEEKSVLQQLNDMVTLAANRQYTEAHNTYMKMTLGNKMWNNTIVSHVPASTMKGAREYRRNRDSLNTYDMDPVSQKYMHAVRKLVHFAQCIRPNSDQSKNIVL